MEITVIFSNKIRHTIIPHSTARLQQHCRNVVLQDCNIAETLQNVAATLLQHCSNSKMSACRNIAM